MRATQSRSPTLILALLLAAAATQGCAAAHRYPGYRGKVVDMDTQEPIEGAVVVAVYSKQYFMLHHENSQPRDAEEAVTDAAGEFRLKPNWAFWPSLWVSWWEDEPSLGVFKPGYAFWGFSGYYTRYPQVTLAGQEPSGRLPPEQ